MNTTNRNDIELLLPFYLNGTLEQHEIMLVEQALQESEELQQELNFLAGIQKKTKQQPVSTSPGEIGFKRLQRSIDKENKVIAQKSMSNGWRFTAIAASLLLVVQSITTLMPTEDYQAAGDQTINQPAGLTLSVTFSPDITEQQLREVLTQYRISIINGPSALGIYQLRLTHAPKATLEKIKSRTDIFESIQMD